MQLNFHAAAKHSCTRAHTKQKAITTCNTNRNTYSNCALQTSAIHLGNREYESFAAASSTATFALLAIAKSTTPEQNTPSYCLARPKFSQQTIKITALRVVRMAALDCERRWRCVCSFVLATCTSLATVTASCVTVRIGMPANAGYLGVNEHDEAM